MGCKDIRTKKYEFVAKTRFLYPRTESAGLALHCHTYLYAQAEGINFKYSWYKYGAENITTKFINCWFVCYHAAFVSFINLVLRKPTFFHWYLMLDWWPLRRLARARSSSPAVSSVVTPGYKSTQIFTACQDEKNTKQIFDFHPTFIYFPTVIPRKLWNRKTTVRLTFWL